VSADFSTTNGAGSSERMTVLRLLEQGKITAAEAAELLKALQEGQERPRAGEWASEAARRAAEKAEEAARRAAERAQRVAWRGRRAAEFWARHADEVAARAAEQAIRAAEQIGEGVTRVLAGLPDLMERAARTGWGNWGPGFRFEEVVEGELEGEQGPAGLDLEGWNGPVRLRGVDGRHVRLVLRKSVHAAGEEAAREVASAVSGVITGRQVSVRRNPQAPAWPGGLALEVELPRTALWGGVVRTGNGAIEAEGLTLRGLRLETSNGRVALQGCGGEDVVVLTSNGRIEASGLRGRVELRTSNASIGLGLSAGGADPAAPEGETEVTAVTSNGSIEVAVPAGLAVEVDASTSNGRIDGSGLGVGMPVVQGVGRAELRWRSPAWEGQPARARLYLRTTNGSIRFR
jgi:hypothetical protein